MELTRTLNKVATLLDDEGFVVETVLNAKVPIVKFSGKSGNHFFSGELVFRLA